MKEDDKLAAALDRKLKALPEREAPHALVGNVLQMVREYEARPWWQRSWFEWPLGIRWASGMVALGLLGGLGIVDLSVIKAYAEQVVAVLQQVTTMVEPFVEPVFVAIANLPLYVWCLFAVAFGLCWMTTLGLGVVCYQLARTRKDLSH